MNNDWKKEYLQRFCKKEKDLDIPMHEELGVPMASEITEITYILADNPEVIDFIQSLLDKQIEDIEGMDGEYLTENLELFGDICYVKKSDVLTKLKEICQIN